MLPAAADMGQAPPGSPRFAIMAMNILAIDPSPTSTGYACSVGGDDLKSGSKNWTALARAGGAPEERVAHEALALAQDFVIVRHRAPMALFIEEPRFLPRKFDIWGTGGVIAFWRAMMAAAHRGGYDQIHSVQPQTWRKAVLGNGNADKSEARRWCLTMDLGFPGADEAEALCIEHYGRSLLASLPAGMLFSAGRRSGQRSAAAWRRQERQGA